MKHHHQEWSFARWGISDVERTSYTDVATRYSYWANLSNLERLSKLYDHGGIYLDTDVYVLRPFDYIANSLDFFIGFEDDNDLNTAIMGSVASHPITKLMRDSIATNYPGNEKADIAATSYITELLREFFPELSSRTISINREYNAAVFPKAFFSPFSWQEIHDFRRFNPVDEIPEAPESAYCIHCFLGRWSHPDKTHKGFL